jgi:hypothetical protein
MKRLLFVLVALVLSVAAASADVTVTMIMSTSAGPTAAEGTIVSFAKGTKFRADTSAAGQDITVMSDTATKQQWMINHVTKLIEPFNAEQVMAGLPISFGDAKVSVKPNGQTKEILGRACQGYSLEMTVPMNLAGETITLRMTGSAWVAKDGVGVAEFKAAQKAFSDAGMSTSPMAQGPQGKPMAALDRTLSDAGVTMEQELQTTMEGTGQMAQMMSQMGSVTLTTKVTAISVDPIPDSKFALPEGYTKK